MEITIDMPTTQALRALHALEAIVESPFVAIPSDDRNALASLTIRLRRSREEHLFPRHAAEPAAAAQMSDAARARWRANYRAKHDRALTSKSYSHAAEV